MELLGLLDALESEILQGHKIPLTRKLLVDEEKILDLLDKIRLVAKNGPEVIRSRISRLADTKAPAGFGRTAAEAGAAPAASASQIQKKTADIINQAYQVAEEVRSGAEKYADEILSNLLVIATRLQRNIETGRQRLSKIKESPDRAAAKTEQSYSSEAPAQTPAPAADNKNQRPVEVPSASQPLAGTVRAAKSNPARPRLIDDFEP